MRPRRMNWLSTGEYTLLAALLLADGEYVSATELAWGLFPRRISKQASRVALRRFALNAQRAGVPLGERYLTEARVLWYRLTALPADEHLEPMLACVPAVKRSAWWQTQLARTRIQAS